MDVKKGDLLVYVGEKTSVLNPGETATVLSKNPQGVKVEFEDGSKGTLKPNMLKKDWELKETDEVASEEDQTEEVQEDVETEQAEEEHVEAEVEEESKAEEKKPVKKSAKKTMKKEPNPEVVKNKEAFFEACKEKGCEVVEQSPFFAVKYNKKPIFEVFKSKQNFNLNCSEGALSDKQKKLGRVLGHGRTNDFRVENQPIDDVIGLIDSVIEFSIKRSEQLKQKRQESFKKVRVKKGQSKAEA